MGCKHPRWYLNHSTKNPTQVALFLILQEFCEKMKTIIWDPLGRMKALYEGTLKSSWKMELEDTINFVAKPF